MSYDHLLISLGFNGDPFAKTNADEEERLETYFIPPPFFTAVYGTPATPKSSFVFAPRGYGKTALKRKIEIASHTDNILCITYNFFPTSGKKLIDIDQKYHLTNLIRLILLAILTGYFEKQESNSLDSDDKHVIYLFIKEYLSSIEKSELKNSIKAIKNFSDKAIEVWNKFTGPIGYAVNNIFEHFGFKAPDIKKYEQAGGVLGDEVEQLEILAELSKKLNYDSIYILIDKVDENNLTNTAANTYEFIAPLLKDLQILELKNYAFKFFLWDAILENYRKVARPDRIKYYELHWSKEQLLDMLSKRLKAYSQDKVLSLNQIFESTDFNIDSFLVDLSQGSPRTLIRICKEIVDQQSQINHDSNILTASAMEKGLNEIAKNIAMERYSDNVVRELTKSSRCDFTIRYIYADVFKFTQQAGMSKVTGWIDCGAVKQIGTIQETKGAKFSNHYNVADVLLAKAIFPTMSISQFKNMKLRNCTCGYIVLRDWDRDNDHICENCQQSLIG